MLLLPFAISLLYFYQIYCDSKRDFALQAGLQGGQVFAQVDETALKQPSTPQKKSAPASFWSFYNNPDDRGRFRASVNYAFKSLAFISLATLWMTVVILLTPGWSTQQLLNVGVFGGLSLIPFAKYAHKKYQHSVLVTQDSLNRQRYVHGFAGFTRASSFTGHFPAFAAGK